MKPSSTLARMLFALTCVLILVFPAFAADRAGKAVDFGRTAMPDNPALGKTGCVVKIQSASIAKDGTITARVTIKDTAGRPLDRTGMTTPGAVTLRFIAAYMPAGFRQYMSYTTTVLNATLNKNPAQTQAATDSGGTFTDNAIGDYTYTFKTKAPANFDPAITHAIGVSAQRNLADYGEFDEWSQTGNDVFNFVPNGTQVKTTRSVVTTEACNNCHNPLYGHGGSRLTVEMCILCHQPQTVNPDTLHSQDMPVLIHKIHMGANLPSVKAGTPYRIWHRNQWSDFSEVVFPQDVRNCTACHVKDAAQADAWKTNPSRAACGACHDNVNFATGENHVDLPQVTDNQCANCHVSKDPHEFDASIQGAHTIPNNSAALPGIVLQILKIENATPGNSPVVTFKVSDKTGNPVDISKLTSMRVVISGNNVDYGVAPLGMARVSEDPSKTPGANGTYAYTMTSKIPATAKGSYTISLQARNTVTLMAGTTKQRTASDLALPVRKYFSVDSSEMTPRRQVVSTEKCNACHKELTFIHGGTRNDVMECAICHNPTLVDAALKQSVNFATMTHSIHRGENLENPYVLGTANYQEVRFPGNLRDCDSCHVNNSQQVNYVGAKAVVQSPGAFTPATPPIAAACQGCHDDQATASHALANTTAIGESCRACHGMNAEFSVDRAHGRKQ